MSKIIIACSVFSSILPAIALCKNFKLLKHPYRLYGGFLIFTVVTEAFAYYFSSKGINNMFVFHFFHATNFSILTYFIVKLGDFSTGLKSFAYIGIFAFLLWHLYYVLILNDLKIIDTLQLFIQSLWFSFWCLIYMQKYLQADEVNFNSMNFLIIFATMFYYVVNFFIFSANELTALKNVLPFYPWVIQSVVNIITNCIYTYAFLCLVKTKSSY